MCGCKTDWDHQSRPVRLCWFHFGSERSQFHTAVIVQSQIFQLLSPFQLPSLGVLIGDYTKMRFMMKSTHQIIGITYIIRIYHIMSSKPLFQFDMPHPHYDVPLILIVQCFKMTHSQIQKLPLPPKGASLFTYCQHHVVMSRAHTQFRVFSDMTLFKFN